MKFLIFTVAVGEGHNSCARNLSSALEGRGHTCKIVNTMTVINPVYNVAVKDVISLYTGPCKRTYRRIYCSMENQPVSRHDFILKKAKHYCMKIGDYITAEQPDVVIYTHIFAGMLLHQWRLQKNGTLPIIGVLTDFAVFPYWQESRACDKLISPSSLLNDDLLAAGYRPDQIVSTGIPVLPPENRSKAEAKRALGFPDDKPVVLIMGGGIGYGRIPRLLRTVDRAETDFRIVTVCGTNKRAERKSLALQLKHSSTVFGFTDRVPLLMDAADCILTKPGGLTSSEAMARLLPMIIYNEIPGHEERNRDFLISAGVATAPEEGESIDRFLDRFFGDASIAESLRSAMRKELSHPDSMEKFCQLAEDLGRSRMECEKENP